MLDYQRVVDELRSFLQSNDQTLTDPLKELAAQYAQACREANERLRRCEEFLQRGLRSEAVHFAQAEPVLLDLVAALDFPERPQWDEVALQYSLPAPPKLLLETAEALNRAYADEQPLDDLLRKHRLLALGRAPLTARLGVLRRIAVLDARNPVWQDDVAEFEKRRLRDLEHEADRAASRNDGPGLAAVWEEINKTRWLTPPPAPLVQHVARRYLEKVETELADALTATNVPRLQQLRDHWNDLTRVADLPQTNPLWRRPARALSWLAKQERAQAAELAYQAALANLEQALDRNLPRAEIERCGYAALQHQRGLPAALAARYQERLHSLAGAVRRREWLFVAGIFVVGVLLLFCLIAFTRHLSAERRRGEAVQTLQQMLETGRLSEARSFLADLARTDAETANRPEVLELKDRLAAEQKRRTLGP
jgi:hypothetical protein